MAKRKIPVENEIIKTLKSGVKENEVNELKAKLKD